LVLWWVWKLGELEWWWFPASRCRQRRPILCWKESEQPSSRNQGCSTPLPSSQIPTSAVISLRRMLHLSRTRFRPRTALAKLRSAFNSVKISSRISELFEPSSHPILLVLHFSWSKLPALIPKYRCLHHAGALHSLQGDV
jgi:hypothetical protein